MKSRPWALCAWGNPWKTGRLARAGGTGDTVRVSRAASSLNTGCGHVCQNLSTLSANCLNKVVFKEKLKKIQLEPAQVLTAEEVGPGELWVAPE